MIKTILAEQPIYKETDSLILRPVIIKGLLYNGTEFTNLFHIAKYKITDYHYITLHKDDNILIWGYSQIFDNLVEMAMIIKNLDEYLLKKDRLISLQIKMEEYINDLLMVTCSSDICRISMSVLISADNIFIFINDYIIGLTGKMLNIKTLIEFVAMGKYLYETSKR